jgi:hypothetical protein
MQNMALKVGIDGLGPLGRQLLRELLLRVQDGDERRIPTVIRDAELALDPERVVASIARDGARAGPRLRVAAENLRFAAREIELTDAPIVGLVDMILEGNRGAGIEGEAEALLGLFEPLCDAFGMRWGVLHVRRSREEVALRGSAWPQSGHASDEGPLARALLEAVPELAGKLETTATLGLGPSTTFDLAVMLAGPPSLEQVLDRLRDAGRDGRIELRTHRSSDHEPCGHPRTIVDGVAARAAGPLVRLCGGFDPLAVLARKIVDDLPV